MEACAGSCFLFGTIPVMLLAGSILMLCMHPPASKECHILHVAAIMLVATSLSIFAEAVTAALLGYICAGLSTEYCSSNVPWLYNAVLFTFVLLTASCRAVQLGSWLLAAFCLLSLKM
jgi:hypothetical protein